MTLLRYKDSGNLLLYIATAFTVKSSVTSYGPYFLLHFKDLGFCSWFSILVFALGFCFQFFSIYFSWLGRMFKVTAKVVGHGKSGRSRKRGR